MCGIIGVFNSDNAALKCATGISFIYDRGRDCCGIAFDGSIIFAKTPKKLASIVSDSDSSSALAHCLHSIVGQVPQPLRHEGILIANCEIYNWKELASEHRLDARNDSDLLLRLIDKRGAVAIKDVLDDLDGVFAFAYLRGDSLIVARDIFGVKPVWYSCKDGFAFCSERKALISLGYASEDVVELNPRSILRYDVKTGKLSMLKRKFFGTTPMNRSVESELIKQVEGLFVNSVAKRIPDQKVGILFSGGIDSTLIAITCKRLGVPFTCYTAALKTETGAGALKEAEDLVYAKRVAKELGLPLKVRLLSMADVEERLREVIPLIEDTNVVKVGVGLTFHVACEEAQKDGIRVMFSGLGSEELFAGYERHKGSQDINKECLSGLIKIYERDLYRDDVITMHHNIELRLPFLDKALAEHALKIPVRYKLDSKQNKIIIRKVAEALGVPVQFAQRKKRAAQYGSNFDKAIKRLSKKAGFDTKSIYLDHFLDIDCQTNPRLGVLFSGGKDSCFAMYVMQKQNYPIACLISLKSRNPDSYMFHTPNIHLVQMQADAMGIPLVEQETAGEKEKELKDLERAISRAKKEYCLEGVVTGALYSNYQRDRIEKICDKLGLKIFSPLWHFGQEKEMRQLVDQGFKVVMSSIAAEGLTKKWLGKVLTQNDVDKLVVLHNKIGFHVAGEGGEFESSVLDGPMFKKRIDIVSSEVMRESDNVARLNIKKAKLVKK